MGCCRGAREGGGQPESLVDLDGCEGGEVDADSAAAFAQQLLADKARHSAQQGAMISTIERPHPSQRAVTDGIRLSTAAASLDELHGSAGLRQPRELQKAQTAESSDSLGTDVADSLGSGSFDDLAEYVVGDSEEDEDLAQPDTDEEQQLLTGCEATAVDDGPTSPPLHCSQRKHGSSHAARGKENVLWRGPHAAKPMPGQKAEQQPRARGQQAPRSGIADALHSSGGPNDCAEQEQLASQPGRKQLQRLYDVGSEPAPGQASDAFAQQDSEDDNDPRDSYLMDCNDAEDAIRLTDLRYRAMRDDSRQQLLHQIDGGGSDAAVIDLSASEEEHAVGASLSGDHVQELGTHSSGNDYAPDSWPGGVGAHRTQHVTMQPAASTGSAQHSVDSWDSRPPRSSAPARAKRSVSPETSQQRPCSQVCLTTF